MSIKENLELYCQLDIESYIRILRDELNVQDHPNQPNAYLLDRLPFYRPTQMEDHISVLSFNNVPLPFSLLQALIDHPEFVPDNTVIRWTQEQGLVLENTIGALRKQWQEIEI